MPYRFKHSFTSGEITPLMEGRVDADRYKNGCKRLYNMIALTQGPATRRPGLRKMQSLNVFMEGETPTKVRLETFVRSSVTAFILAFVESASYSRLVIFYRQQVLRDPVTDNPVYMDLPYSKDAGRWDIDNFDYAQSIDEMYFAQRTHPPYRLVFTGDNFILEKIPITSPPLDPSGGEYWDDINGWPERIVFHQQRMAFAANKLYRDHLWFSAAGEFFNFQEHSSNESGTITDADGFSFSLASGTYNAIQWILSAKGLHIGTVGDEWTVTGSTQAALTATSKLALRQTMTGSEPQKPLLVGNTTLFINRGGNNISEFVYDYNYDSYKTSDLSVIAPHLTDLYPLIDWTYQKDPYGIIWTVRKDGAFLGLTYQREHNVVGWHTHATQGTVMAITAANGETREDDLYLAVRRNNDDGTDRVYVEVMADRFLSGHARDGRFLDSFVEYKVNPAPPTVDGPGDDFPINPSPEDDQTDDPADELAGTPIPPGALKLPEGYPEPIEIHVGGPDGITLELTSLEHLEGYSVGICIDGAVYPDQEVIDGKVIVNVPEDMLMDDVKAVVGLNYVSEVRPYVMDMKSDEGTTLGRMQRLTYLDIDFYKTLGGWIGKIDSETNKIVEKEIPFRKPKDIMGTAVPLFTGIYHTDFPEGFSRKSDYFIKQKQPLPMTVRGVTDTMEVFE